jgi:signal transduction histidine kinase
MTTELEERLAAKSREVRVLQQVSSEINSTLNLDEIFGIVLRTMDELFGFHHSMILLLDASGETLSVAASRGYQGQPAGARVAVGTGLVGVVAKKRQLMRLGNLGRQRAYMSTIRQQMEQAGRGSELGESPALPGLSDVESQIGIPLLIKDTLIGVFFVESAEQRVFSEEDEALITVVANQAASAIHNAKLYQAVAEAHERLRQLNETLEDRVRERTLELHQTNRELRETQAQLLQSAKMAALGDLAAGVAHEINTPLGSIHANADLSKRVAAVVRKALADEALAPAFSKHPRLERALEALEQATATTLVASDRIVRIVKSLGNFARLDEAERKKADLHEGIESTLTLLQHKLKHGIEVIRDFGEIPPMVCSPNRLNQVFMNLLLNAIHAVGERGTITIRSRLEGEQVVLQFSDTGHGIPSENLERIFDPGFTTRGPGVGTGLGLAITYRIVEEHRGAIEVSSEVGKGTEFTIRLPIRE